MDEWMMEGKKEVTEEWMNEERNEGIKYGIEEGRTQCVNEKIKKNEWKRKRSKELRINKWSL